MMNVMMSSAKLCIITTGLHLPSAEIKWQSNRNSSHHQCARLRLVWDVMAHSLNATIFEVAHDHVSWWCSYSMKGQAQSNQRWVNCSHFFFQSSIHSWMMSKICTITLSSWFQRIETKWSKNLINMIEPLTIWVKQKMATSKAEIFIGNSLYNKQSLPGQ